MHLLDEVLAERNQQYDAQQSAEKRREEDLPECGVEPEDVERRKGEDRSCDDDARRRADGLDDDILPEHVLLAQHVAHAYGNDGDGYRRLEDLPDFQAEECRRGREDHGHDYAHRHRVGRHFARGRGRRHQGRIFFAGLEFAVGVLRQRSRVVFFHDCLSKLEMKN